MKIKCERVTGRDLKPGDLFSSVGPDYWGTAMDKGSIGERVYIRSNAPTHYAPDADAVIYRVTVEYDEDESIDTSDIPEAGEEFFQRAKLVMPK